MFTPVTLTGTFLRSDGSFASGTGTATLSHRIANGTTVIEPTPVTFHLSPTGTVVNNAGTPLVLEANDDTGTVPSGSFYRFVLDFDTAPVDPFDAVIPHSAGAGTVDLSALIPALP